MQQMPMGDLKNVADEIMRKLADGSLPVMNETEPKASARCERSDSIARPRPSTVERLTPDQAKRRNVIKAMLLRYRLERNLNPLSDDALYDFVRWHDEHFTHNGIPTERIMEVYLEAMAQHGRYPLNVDDFIRAWDRIRPVEGSGVDLRPMGQRGQDCAICGGTGMTEVFIPTDFRKPEVGEMVKKECPYHCAVITSVSVRG